MAASLSVFKTATGFLKFFHMVFGAVALGIVSYYACVKEHPSIFPQGVLILDSEVFFFMMVTFAFLVTSFLLMLSYFFEGTAETLGSSCFEIMYHLFGFIFHLAAAIPLCSILIKNAPETRDLVFDLLVFVDVCAFANSIAYAANSVVAYKLRKG